MRKRVDEAVGAVYAMCAPGFMTTNDAIDFLEDVLARLEARIEVLRNEIEEDDPSQSSR
jgi:prefoldin subunit 5